jgi:hypothetical protein
MYNVRDPTAGLQHLHICTLSPPPGGLLRSSLIDLSVEERLCELTGSSRNLKHDIQLLTNTHHVRVVGCVPSTLKYIDSALQLVVNGFGNVVELKHRISNVEHRNRNVWVVTREALSLHHKHIFFDLERLLVPPEIRVRLREVVHRPCNVWVVGGSTRRRNSSASSFILSASSFRPRAEYVAACKIVHRRCDGRVVGR